MKISAPTNLSNVKDADELKRYTGIFAAQVEQILNTNLSFVDNFNAKILTFVFTAANKTVGMDHNLGSIPSGYIQIGADVAVSLFDGNQKNTVQTLYLQASTAATVKVVVLG